MEVLLTSRQLMAIFPLSIIKMQISSSKWLEIFSISAMPLLSHRASKIMVNHKVIIHSKTCQLKPIINLHQRKVLMISWLVSTTTQCSRISSSLEERDRHLMMTTRKAATWVAMMARMAQLSLLWAFKINKVWVVRACQVAIMPKKNRRPRGWLQVQFQISKMEELTLTRLSSCKPSNSRCSPSSKINNNSISNSSLSSNSRSNSSVRGNYLKSK